MKCKRKLRRPLIRCSLVMLLLWAIIAWLPLQQIAAESSGKENKKVLFLAPGMKEAPLIAKYDALYQQTLSEGLGGHLDYYSEYLDLTRFSDPGYIEALRDFLRRKYAGVKFDLIIVSDTALKFLSKYADDLFPGTPVVYKGFQDLHLGPNFFPVLFEPPFKGSLESGLKLQPETRQVYVICGASEPEQQFEQILRRQFHEFEDRFAFTYLGGLPLRDLLQTVAHLPANSIIYYFLFSEDVEGNKFIPMECLEKISAVANAPIYHYNETSVGHGAVGGRVQSTEKLARLVAEQGLRVLNGERPATVSLNLEQTTVLVFDWRELRRWDISENSLPPGSLVLFKELTFWEHYRWYIVGVLSLCAIEALLIAFLLIERGRRQRANAALDSLNVELEERVVERTAALGAKTRELETFAYSVAHDLKAPLRGIDGYSRLLLEGYTDKLDEEGSSFLHTIRSSTNEMSQLIEDLLDYSRLERQEMTCRQIELRPLVESLVEKKRNELGEREVEFTLNVNGGTVIADQNGLAQALRNYIDNAIKFTGGTPESHIEIGAEETERDCRLWVRDNGVGFDMKYHDKIFEIFTRLHRDEEYAGTGIGLAIARKAVERMHGRVWAESSPGEGATFYLEIPKGGGRSNESASQDNHKE